VVSSFAQSPACQAILSVAGGAAGGESSGQSSNQSGSQAPVTRGLRVTPDGVEPGGQVTVSAIGCMPPAGTSSVDLLVNDQVLATIEPGVDGSFKTRLTLPSLAPGRYLVEARCDPALATVFDVISTTSQGSASTAAVVVTLFFLLLGSAVARKELI
jgi:hypothetical protein